MSLLTTIVALLAPEKHLHNQSMALQQKTQDEYAERNAFLAQQAMEMAKDGYSVELKCTNGGWVELRIIPPGNDARVVNGKVVRFGN